MKNSLAKQLMLDMMNDETGFKLDINDPIIVQMFIDIDQFHILIIEHLVKKGQIVMPEDALKLQCILANTIGEFAAYKINELQINKYKEQGDNNETNNVFYITDYCNDKLQQ